MKKFKGMLAATLLVLVMTAGAAMAKEYISVGANPVGMALYTMGAGLSDVAHKQYPDINITIEATKGGIHNLFLLRQGDIEFAFTAPNAAKDAYEGKGKFEGGKVPVLGMFSHQIAYQQVPVLGASDIATPGDFKGKRIGIGPPGSLSREDSMNFLSAYGITPDDFKAFSETLPEMAEKMKNGQLDATMWFGGIPLSPLMDLAQSRPLKWINADEGQLAKLIAENPIYFIADLPAGTYPNQSETIKSLAYRHSFVVRADADEELVYTLMKIVFDNLPHLAKIHRGWAMTSFDNALQSLSIPLHPGAIRYFREKGHPGIEEYMKIHKN